MVESFIRHNSRIALETPIFKLREDRCEHPSTGHVGDYVVLESPNWVNVIPVTTDGKLILVRQWRHGTRSVELEIPAGLIDEGEEPIAAGARELQEETGYKASRWEVIGRAFPNPAFQDNVCTTVLALDCEPTGEIDFDPGEDLEVVLAEVAEVVNLVREGKLRHGVTLNALFWWFDHDNRIQWPS